MKKLKLLLPLASAVAATAAVVPVLASCNNKDTKVVGYTIDRDTDCIYGLNKDKERIQLSAEQIDALKDCFLITRRGEAGYILVDSQGKGSDGKQYPTTVSGFISDASSKYYMEYELFLINGHYELDDVNITGSHPAVWLNGVMSYDGELLSEIDCVPGHGATKPGTDKIELGGLPSLSMRSLKIVGAQSCAQSGNHAWCVTGVNEIDVTWSYMYGVNMFTTTTCAFESTWFNSADVELSEKLHTDYSLWLEGTRYAYFSDCHFWSRGKAVKIHHPNSTTPIETTYIFDSCDFNISEKGIPSNTDKTPDQNKFCVDVNNIAGSAFSAANPMIIYWYLITGDIGPDYDTQHGGTIGGVDTTQFNPEYAHIENIIP